MFEYHQVHKNPLTIWWKKLTLNLKSVWLSSSTQNPLTIWWKKIGFELEKCLNIIYYTKPTYNLMNKKKTFGHFKCLNMINYTKPNLWFDRKITTLKLKSEIRLPGRRRGRSLVGKKEKSDGWRGRENVWYRKWRWIGAHRSRPDCNGIRNVINVL